MGSTYIGLIRPPTKYIPFFLFFCLKNIKKKKKRGHDGKVSVSSLHWPLCCYVAATAFGSELALSCNLFANGPISGLGQAGFITPARTLLPETSPPLDF